MDRRREKKDRLRTGEAPLRPPARS